MSLIEWSGDPDEGHELLREIQRELDPPAGELATVPYLAIQSITDELLAPGTLHAYLKAGFTAELTDDLIDALIDRGAERRLPPLGDRGARARRRDPRRPERRHRVPPPQTRRWLINIAGQWREPGATDDEIAWVRDTFAALEPHLTGGAYSNFMDDDDAEPAAAAYGPTLARLREIKAIYDPDNVFRLNQNIEPAAMSDQSVIDEQRELWSSNPRDWAEIAEPQNRTSVRRAARPDRRRAREPGCSTSPAGRAMPPRSRPPAAPRSPASTSRRRCSRSRASEPRTAPSSRARWTRCRSSTRGSTWSPRSTASSSRSTPRSAFAEAARVLVPGGRLAAATFAEPERNEGTALHLAMKALVDEPADDGYAPYALSSPGGLERDARAAAGLRLASVGEVALAWTYPDTDTTVRALLASAGGARASRAVGERRVREALVAAIEPFRDRAGAVVDPQRVPLRGRRQADTVTIDSMSQPERESDN